jgi:hypothetical protein
LFEKVVGQLKFGLRLTRLSFNNFGKVPHQEEALLVFKLNNQSLQLWLDLNYFHCCALLNFEGGAFSLANTCPDANRLRNSFKVFFTVH